MITKSQGRKKKGGSIIAHEVEEQDQEVVEQRHTRGTTDKAAEHGDGEGGRTRSRGRGRGKGLEVILDDRTRGKEEEISAELRHVPGKITKSPTRLTPKRERTKQQQEEKEEKIGVRSVDDGRKGKKVAAACSGQEDCHIGEKIVKTKERRRKETTYSTRRSRLSKKGQGEKVNKKWMPSSGRAASIFA